MQSGQALANGTTKCLGQLEQQGIAVFKRNCDKCEKDLVSTENAFRECNERSKGSATTEVGIVMGVVGLVGGYFLGRGAK